MGVPEKGITLALKEETAVHADLLDCGDCIQDIYGNTAQLTKYCHQKRETQRSS